MPEFYTVGCAKCGDFYRTRHEGRAIAVRNGMQRTVENDDGEVKYARMHGNGHVDHSHEGLGVVVQRRDEVTD